ncbi:hypothetical protein GCM10023340_04290 [Nocardioides marinquilinus]|uniref:Cutinase family protein n=1 Tax=Nocardioides marinquilinus TaxID=1210400 RepID=A0ABP9P845_9ACTN
MSVSPGGAAEIHGKILNSTVGVSSDYYVDASDVDWGHPSGPAPIGTGTRIRGEGVDVLPWTGWVQPALPPPAAPGITPGSSSNQAESGCKQVMFLAVRGSGEDPFDQAGDAAYNNWLSGMGPNIWQVYTAFNDQLNVRGYTGPNNQKGIGLRYTAMHVPIIENVLGGWPQALSNTLYTASIWQGVDRIEQYLNDEVARCGSTQKYVLAGYSQGALAIHLYLTQRAPDTPGMLNRIAAVGLQADPAKNQNGAEHTFTDGFSSAGPGTDMKNAKGIYRKAILPGSGPLPDAITARTATLCHDNDIVCAPGFGSWITQHTNYTNAELRALGTWLANTAANTGLPPR